MKLVFISDTHGMHDQLSLPPCDILFHCGDLTSDMGQANLRNFCIWFDNQVAKHKVFIAGNHDGAFEVWPDQARELVRQYCKPNVHYLEDSGVTIECIKIWGSPVQPRFHDWHFNRNRGADIKRHWDMIPRDTEILLTHGPAVGYGDWSPYDKVHTGCEDLLNALMEIKPRFHAYGHIHNGYGVRWLEDTCLINASSCNERYKIVNPPIVINYDPATKTL